MTGSTLEERTKIPGGRVGDSAGDDILGELGDTDEGQRQRDGGEVVYRRADKSAVEP